MSKFVKGLMIKDLAHRLKGVDAALLVNVVGLTANKTVALRRDLREKDIHLMVVKTNIARKAAEGTVLARAFDKAEGPLALVWGAEDFVSLVKEITKIDKAGEYDKFATRGGVMDGEHLTAEKVKEISKWPSRIEQLSILSGQILSPGSRLASQLIGPGGALASQIEKKSEGAEAEASEGAGEATEGSSEASGEVSEG